MAPFPSSQLFPQNGGNRSRARRCCAACEPLTDSLRSVQSGARGKGGRGSQGACPLAEFEAAPHARLQRALSPAPISLPSAHHSLGIVLLPVDFSAPCRHASIRTLIAASAAGACWCSQFKGCCHLSAELRGPSCLVPVVLPRPRSHPNSALSHTPQNSNPFQIRFLMRLAFLRPFACLCRLPVVLRIVHFPRHPQMVQQYRQLPRHCHGRFLLPTLAPFLPSPGPTFVSPHAFRSLSGAPSRRMQCAACTNSRRTNSSPALLIPNSGALSPLSRCFLVSPKYGPTSRLCSNRSASSSVKMKVNAPAGPLHALASATSSPGTVSRSPGSAGRTP